MLELASLDKYSIPPAAQDITTGRFGRLSLCLPHPQDETSGTAVGYLEGLPADAMPGYLSPLRRRPFGPVDSKDKSEI